MKIRITMDGLCTECQAPCHETYDFKQRIEVLRWLVSDYVDDKQMYCCDGCYFTYTERKS